MAPNDIRSQMQLMFDSRRGQRPAKEVVNTRNILFIVSGAFSGIDKIIEKRAARGSIGFGAALSEKPATETLLRQSRTQDFIDFGFEAEFIGRLPVRVVCDALTAEDLFQIMKSSEGSLIRQFEREFSAYGVRASFEDDALHVIAARAAEEKTGARGLVTAWEQVLRDFKFELPSLGLPELRVDAALVNDPGTALAACREQAQVFHADVRSAEVQAFADAFKRAYGLELIFTVEAVRALIERVEREGSSVESLCARLLKDYPFGLQLVARNSGSNSFTLDRGAVEDADRHLSELVARSYRETHSVNSASPGAEFVPPSFSSGCLSAPRSSP